LLILFEIHLRLPADQTEKRDGSGRRRFGQRPSVATESSDPAWLGFTGKEKDPEKIRALEYGGLAGIEIWVFLSKSITCLKGYAEECQASTRRRTLIHL
jgi:hypothetical protein